MSTACVHILYTSNGMYFERLHIRLWAIASVHVKKEVYLCFKGLVHPKMKILSLITYPHIILNRKTHAFWCSCEHASKTDTEEKKLLNKFDILFSLRTKSILVAS